ncbi:hypothetical protein BOX15_Mlig004853g1 [Macrostomum lignano]|uniref:Mitochondrial enolase superfamily member 1 n=1 Tax=Macrostomum lignano TaxID=282301 RepID=A0A267F2X0_9PLAT|nr:hypothetical protein BOX15_Mlig004853g1 [Macrostomum lignano]
MHHNLPLDCPIRIVSLKVTDVRFPTSEGSHGSDAIHPDPDYSAAYVELTTSEAGLKGCGSAFTLGRGTEVIAKNIESLKHYVEDKKLESIVNNFRNFYHALVNDGQMRWLGPEKGVLHMACSAILNAIWDLWAKVAGKPVWKLLSDMRPQQLVDLIDFTYISDYLTPDEALQILAEDGKENDREGYLNANGYPAYTTSAGWLGYSEQTIREQHALLSSQGFDKFKVKVGQNLESDRARLRLLRELCGPQGVLMTDANQRWSVPEAVAWMRQLAEFQPYWIEEPTSPDDMLGHRAVRDALQPLGVRVATGEMCQNKVLFKQFFQAAALDVCQIDACRLASVNEVLPVLLMAAKAGVPVCPHAGGLGLCEYVQHYIMFDYIRVSRSLQDRMCEYSSHLHEHFVHPVRMKNGAYLPPEDAGFNTEMLATSVEQAEFKK